MKYHTKDPTRKPKVPKHYIIFPQRIGSRDRLAQSTQTMVMGEEIEQREENTEGFLHAQKPIEGPFSVELEDGFAVGWIASEALVSYYVLAGVIAF